MFLEKKTVLSEDFDFGKVKKQHIQDEYQIDKSFEHTIELIKKKTKVYTNKFLQKLGREKCKEYLDKYFKYLNDNTKYFNYICEDEYYIEKVYRCHDMVSDLHSVKFSAHPEEIYKIEDEIIEKEEYDFIIFLCMLLSGKLYILLTGNAYNSDSYNFDAKLSTIQIGNLYLYSFDEIENIDHINFQRVLKCTGNIVKDNFDHPVNKYDNNINQKITVSFDQDKEKFIIQTT